MESTSKKNLKKRFFTYFGIFFVVGFIIFLSYGYTFLMDKEWFNLFWKFVWFGVVPFLLFFSFKQALKGRSKVQEQKKGRNVKE